MSDISRAFVEQKLAELRKQYEQHIANANATAGAIGLCEMLLEQAPEPPKE